MNSLEWRTRNLENKVFGYLGANSFQNFADEPLNKQLDQAAKLYKSFHATQDNTYLKFLELYKEVKDLLRELEEDRTSDISEAAKAELVLAYHEDLTRHLESVAAIAQKADNVLDVSKWPDLRQYTDRLEKLETITREQHLQSVQLDKRTEELVEVYNQIISSFRANIGIWNQKLEAFENEQGNSDEDV